MSDELNPFRRPATHEYFEYYAKYIQQVPAGDVRHWLAAQENDILQFFQGVSEPEAEQRHPPYTWTFKQVVGHLIDAERIFADRLHRFSAGDLTPLPGMEQDPYIQNQDLSTPTLQNLVEELLALRKANRLLVQRIKPAAWDHCGMASDHPVTVRALIHILVGHINHHLNILKRRRTMTPAR